ncbi:ABC-type spermidine/putrescine transport system permease subunit I [Aminobacter niigataensis]|uniref:ABC-type spermidine/putrescine transport system permease subunit I n=1 Tax=Aminobacter niigataensis TaxID=83265 RepID=A0ABR6L671_9HYPH|nr:ABC transporter permease [Aminobacter niigataensis]MBB4651496.1 ABC-type spermidine/putrescine transport system permease subunit I [Aminobacter niigataensis]
MPLYRISQWALIAPALVLVIALFMMPIAWFVGASLAELGSIDAIWSEAKSVLGSRAILGAIWTTNVIALVVTISALIIGYPLSYALSRAKGLAFSLILICIVVPYFTSVVVRTYAWMVILGRNGIVNQVLLSTGLINEPLNLMYNRLGVVIGMTYVLLPYMVLTLFGAMKAVDSRLLQAAEGMGARPLTIFAKVFLPLTLHGVMAGSLIVFILAIGFFITPALMGGTGDIMMATLIEREIEVSQNWPVAALMTIALLAITLTLYALYGRFADRSGERFV